MIEAMKTPLFIRSLTENERRQIQADLRSKDAFVAASSSDPARIRSRRTSTGHHHAISGMDLYQTASGGQNLLVADLG
jgi:hypothetical protein